MERTALRHALACLLLLTWAPARAQSGTAPPSPPPEAVGLDLSQPEPTNAPAPAGPAKAGAAKAGAVPAGATPAGATPARAAEARAAEAGAAEAGAAEAGAAEAGATEAGAAEGAEGLDLKGPDDGVDAALRPTWVLLGVAGDGEVQEVAADWAEALVRAVQDGGAKVAPGPSAAEVAELLGERVAAGLACRDAACLAPLAEALDVDLLTVVRLGRVTDGWAAAVRTLVRDGGRVETAAARGAGPRDFGLLGDTGSALVAQLQALAVPRARLRVTTNVPGAVVQWNTRVLGVGSLEARLPPGKGRLDVTADGLIPFARELDLLEGVTLDVDAPLAAEQLASDVPYEELRGRPVPLWRRPGLYSAVLGLGAAGAGAALLGGTDGGRTVPLALLAGGGALALGSAGWLVLVPAPRVHGGAVGVGGRF